MENLPERPIGVASLDKAAIKWVLRTVIIFIAMATFGFWGHP